MGGVKERDYEVIGGGGGRKAKDYGGKIPIMERSGLCKVGPEDSSTDGSIFQKESCL